MRDPIARIIRVGMALCVTGIVATGCETRQPTGQVLASVDGDEVTKRDLAVEAALTNLPPGRETLEAIVDRKLLVRAARRDRLDRTPEYLAAVRRFREATLATLAVQEATGALPPPDATALRAYAAAHGWQFADRRLIDVADGRTRRTIDVATLADGGLARRLLTAPVGTEVTLAGQRLRILAARLAAPAPEAQLAAARDGLMRARREEVVRQLVAAERASIRIRYQSGLGPTS